MRLTASLTLLVLLSRAPIRTSSPPSDLLCCRFVDESSVPEAWWGRPPLCPLPVWEWWDAANVRSLSLLPLEWVARMATFYADARLPGHTGPVGLPPLADDPRAVFMSMPGHDTEPLDDSLGAVTTALNVCAFGSFHRMRCKECREHCERVGHQWKEDKDRVCLSVSPSCYARRLLHSLSFGFAMRTKSPFAPWVERPRSHRVEAGRPGVDAAWAKICGHSQT